MIRPLRVLSRAVLDCVYLLRGPYRPLTKLRILFEYWRLTLKLVCVAPFVPVRSERILGFRVAAFDYESLHFLFREIFVRSQYWSACPNDRPLIFDCGANIGLATIFFKWRYPHCTIHCFEPDRRTFEVLRGNVRANRLSDVQLHNVALSDAAGPVEFFVVANRAGSLLMSMDPHRLPEADIQKTLVDGVRLSTFVNGRAVDLVKMDVEGAEQAVLADLVRSGTIAMVRELVVEYHHHVDRGGVSLGAFLCRLEDAGFHYQLDAAWASASPPDEFQDVLVHAVRPGRQPLHAQGVLR